MAPSHAKGLAHFTPAPKPDPLPPRRSASPSVERRRRARHYRLRRRDLVEDLGAGLLGAILLLVLTAGLGMLALLDLALVGGLVVSGVIARRRRRRNGRSAHAKWRPEQRGRGRQAGSA